MKILDRAPVVKEIGPGTQLQCSACECWFELELKDECLEKLQDLPIGTPVKVRCPLCKVTVVYGRFKVQAQAS